MKMNWMLPQKFTLYPKVKLDEILMQKQVCDTKCRWERIDRMIDEKGDLILEEDDEVYREDKEVVEENRCNEVYDPERKEVNFTKVRATNIKSNPRVQMPGSRPAREEAQLAARTSLIENTVNQYRGKIQCIENLTPSERRGLKKLGKRVQNK